MIADPLLELRRATVSLGRTRALDEISLTLAMGEHTAIVGPNGSGKSSLVHLLSGRLYPVANGSGEPPVRILGRERWNLTELRSRIGIISADMHQRFVSGSSLGHVTAIEAVLGSFFSSEVLFHHHVVQPGMREAARSALERVGADHLADRRLDRMSTGEARRVLVARALVHSPQVLILDEPTTGLDAVARHDLLERLRLLARTGTTLITITHHLEEVIPETRRVILLKAGRVAADGRPEEVLVSDVVSEVYGAPVTVEVENGRYRLSIPFAAPDPLRSGEE